MITLQNISKIYKTGKEDFYALRDVSLTVEKGDFLAIRGASGSGKTTLLNMIGCMDRCSEGTYLLEGKSVKLLSDEDLSRIRNEKIGFVLQDFGLINQQTVLYNVMLPALFSKLSLHDARKKAMDALNQVGLSDQLKKRVNQLSGGQRQRVAIARAIVMNPKILLADEPTGQLDSETGKQIMDLLSALNEQGITIILVTHDETVASYAKRVVTVADGKLITAR